MNKQRYLAELGQLLIFMTSADREQTLERFGDLFDQAGPDGADALVGRIGSPTKNAIRLSRSYMPGCLTDELLFQGMDLDGAAEPDTETGPSAGEPGEEPDESEAPEEGTRFVAMPLHEPEPEEDRPAPRRESRVERPMSPWLGAPLFVLALAAVGLPLAALVLALIPVVLAPGALILGGAVLAAIGGLWCTNYVADAVLMFGLAAFVLGLALLALWCGFAGAAGLVKLYIRAVVGLKRLFLGRSVS